MRVLVVTNTYPLGEISGVGALAVELEAACSAAGHTTLIVTRRAPPAHRWTRPTGGPKLCFPLLAAWRALRLSLSQSFDLVQVHESDGALVVVIQRLLRALGVRAGRARIVATLQVSYVRERRAVRALRANGTIVSRPTASEWLFALGRAPILALLGRVTARLADAVVAPSAGTARELEEDYGASVRSVIPNGVGAASAPGRRAPGEAPTVLYAGRLRTRKAVGVLVAAFREVVEALPQARLLLAGDGEQRAALEAQVHAAGLSDRVRFEGVVARERMAELYRQSDVFCLPSTYEGFPVAILEAMSHGLPIVSTRVAGIPEAVEHGVTGLLVEPEDAAALAAALLELLLDSKRRAALGKASLERFEQHYRRELVADAYLALYAELAAG